MCFTVHTPCSFGVKQLPGFWKFWKGHVCFLIWHPEHCYVAGCENQAGDPASQGIWKGNICKFFLYSVQRRTKSSKRLWFKPASSWTSQAWNPSPYLSGSAHSVPFDLQFSSVAQSCLTPCDPTDPSTLGLPVPYQLPVLAQTHIHCQPSHPLLSPSPPAFNLSQHQGLFQWVSSSHQVAKILEFQLQHQSFQWIFRINFL